MRRLLWLLTALILIFGRTTQAQADVLYGATGSRGVNGELVILNSATGAVMTDIGALVDSSGNHYGITGLDFHPVTGVLYGSTAGASPTAGGHLVIINPTTALVTDVGSFGLGGVTLSDITFDPTTGILYGDSGSTGNFYAVNLATGTATSIGSTGVGVTFGGGLAANAGGTIFGSPQPGPGDLFTYNETTGVATSVATLTGAPLGGNLDAMAFSDLGTLFGVNTNGGGPTHLVTIITSTGVITDVGSSLGNLDAIAFQQSTAVPEPSTLTLLGIGAVGLLGFCLRQRKRAPA